MAGRRKYYNDDDDDDKDQASDSGSSDFTPDEQLEMESAQAQAASFQWKNDNYPSSRSSPARISHIISWVVIFCIFAAFASWWRREKIEIGYCDTGRNHWSLDTTNVPDWVTRLLEPKCEECPQHAVCYSNMDIICDPGFVLRQHPLSLRSLIPLPATCEPDGERARRVAAVVNKALAMLREQRAKFECGECLKDGTRLTAPGLSLEELKTSIQRLKRKAITDEEFDDLWVGAVNELQKRNEIVQTSPTPNGVPTTIASTSLVRLSLVCSLKRSVRSTLREYRFTIFILVSIIFGISRIRYRIRTRRSDAARVPGLVALTLDRLAAQAALHARGQAPEPWISIAQLRDDVLRDEHHGKRREEIWSRVRAVVEGNANIRASLREGRGGDVSKVWEWIGGIGGAKVAGDDDGYDYDVDVEGGSGYDGGLRGGITSFDDYGGNNNNNNSNDNAKGSEVHQSSTPEMSQMAPAGQGPAKTKKKGWLSRVIF